MTIDSNSHNSDGMSQNAHQAPEDDAAEAEASIGQATPGDPSSADEGDGSTPSPASASSEAPMQGQALTAAQENPIPASARLRAIGVLLQRFPALGLLLSILVMAVGLGVGSFLLGLIGSVAALAISLRIIWPNLQSTLAELTPEQRSLLIAVPGAIAALIGLMQAVGINRLILQWGRQIRWDAIGALGDFFGAFGQILIAILALYVAWRQYVISRDLTKQQNLITQQQTIDAYFQGVSDLVLDDEGLLEDWPQERAIAEGRTAAILSSIDAGGKAKVVRFLSQSRLLTPLKRDRHLGRPILDGTGGYAEDRSYGLRVIDLGVMLAAADLSGTDLRWTDLSDANLVRANLSGCDLVRANLARTILYDANLSQTDLMGARLFYGEVETASPRSRTEQPNYETGEHTGAVVEGANFTGAQRMSETQRYYCCAWGGNKTRRTVPGGCEGIPNKLGR